MGSADDHKNIIREHPRTLRHCAVVPGWGIPPVHYLLAALSEEGQVPLAGYATYGSEGLAGYASDALGDGNSACLLQNHGTIAVGETASEAYALTEILEEMARIYYRACLAGEPKLLNAEEIADTRAKILQYGQYKAVSSKTELGRPAFGPRRQARGGQKRRIEIDARER